jgi:prepilin-type N-terminal cleavage/methylation domain-containing protein
VIVIAENGRGRCAHRGFTLTELLVANAVVAIALLGVYELFRQVVEVERASSRRWEDRAAAESIVDHLAEAMEHGVNLPNESALAAEPDENGAAVVGCFTQTPMYWGVSMRDAGVSRRRYAWKGGDDPEQAGQLEVRVLTYGGAKNLMPGVVEESDDAAVWNQVTPRVIGQHVDEMAITFRAIDEANNGWQDRGTWQAGQVVARIRVRVGQETVERIVMPRANGTAVAVKEEG